MARRHEAELVDVTELDATEPAIPVPDTAHLDSTPPEGQVKKVRAKLNAVDAVQKILALYKRVDPNELQRVTDTVAALIK